MEDSGRDLCGVIKVRGGGVACRADKGFTLGHMLPQPTSVPKCPSLKRALASFLWSRCPFLSPHKLLFSQTSASN